MDNNIDRCLLYFAQDMWDLAGYATRGHSEFSDLIIGSYNDGHFDQGVTPYGPNKSSWFVLQIEIWFPAAFQPLFVLEKRALPPRIHDDLAGLISRWRLGREDTFVGDYKFDVKYIGARPYISTSDSALIGWLYHDKVKPEPSDPRVSSRAL